MTFYVLSASGKVHRLKNLGFAQKVTAKCFIGILKVLRQKKKTQATLRFAYSAAKRTCKVLPGGIVEISGFVGGTVGKSGKRWSLRRGLRV